MLTTNESVESFLDRVCSDWSKLGMDTVVPTPPPFDNSVEEVKSKDVGSLHRTSPSDVMLSNVELAMTSFPCKLPFFIMDWLDRISPEDLERAQQLLQRQSTTANKSHNDDSAAVPSAGHTLRNKGPKNIYSKSIGFGNSYNAKGIEQARMGVWNEALHLWEKALEVRLCVLGDKHVDVANTYNNIGIAQGKLGLQVEALQSLRKALDIRKDYYGLVHKEVAATLHNIGNVYQQNGELEAALQCFFECKVQQEHIMGSSQHAEVARACIAIGHCYYEADAYVDAREAYMDALTIFRSIGFPEDDSEITTTLEDILDLDHLILSPPAATS